MRLICRDRFVLIAALWLAVYPLPPRAEERVGEPLAVIVSTRWKGPAALDLATLRRLYLGARTQLGGRRVHPLQLPLGSDERKAFSRLVLAMTPRELEHYWIEQALQGGALPPREVSDADSLLRALDADADAVGYVAVSDLADADRAPLRVLGLEVRGRVLTPDQPEYPLQLRARR